MNCANAVLPQHFALIACKRRAHASTAGMSALRRSKALRLSPHQSMNSMSLSSGAATSAFKAFQKQSAHGPPLQSATGVFRKATMALLEVPKWFHSDLEDRQHLTRMETTLFILVSAEQPLQFLVSAVAQPVVLLQRVAHVSKKANR